MPIDQKGGSVVQRAQHRPKPRFDECVASVVVGGGCSLLKDHAQKGEEEDDEVVFRETREETCDENSLKKIRVITAASAVHSCAKVKAVHITL